MPASKWPRDVYKRQDNRRALDLAQAATKRWPEQRALGIAYAAALQSNGRHAEAQDYLRAKIKQWGRCV